jgi:nitroreductase
MDVKDAIMTRLSIRRYAEMTIPQDHMTLLFRALQRAPSASNRQNWEFVFVADKETKQNLVSACFGQRFVGECGFFIAGVVDPTQKWHQVDITIALTNFTLQAAELGYGTCWIGAFDEHIIKALLGIPENKKVVICMTFGKPGEKSFPNSRKRIEEIAYLDGYGKPWEA